METAGLEGKRIGIVLPSSNTVVEPLAAATLAGTGISAHFSRLPVFDVALNDASRAQFLLERHLEAACLLQDANVDAIVWGGTSASWLGAAHDRTVCEATIAETGIPTTSCVLSMNAVLDAFASCRFGLVTPYTEDVHTRIIENYAEMGHRCVASEHLGGVVSRDFAEIDPHDITQMVRRVTVDRPDVVLIMCTNLRGSAAAASLSPDARSIVVDSAAATITAGIALLRRSSG